MHSLFLKYAGDLKISLRERKLKMFEASSKLRGVERAE